MALFCEALVSEAEVNEFDPLIIAKHAASYSLLLISVTLAYNDTQEGACQYMLNLNAYMTVVAQIDVYGKVLIYI